MKTYYILSQDARQVHYSRYDEGAGIQYESLSSPIPAADPEQWLDAAWLHALRQRFPAVPEGWFVSYPFCTAGEEYGPRLEKALAEAGFENARAVADVDAVLAYYEAQPQKEQSIGPHKCMLTVIMSPEESGIFFSSDGYHETFRLPIPAGMETGRPAAFFAALRERLPSVQLCLMAGESSARAGIIDGIKHHYNCPVLVSAAMDKAVHTGLERLAPALAAAGYWEKCWLSVRCGANYLTGMLYQQYRQIILEPLSEMLKVSEHFDHALALWCAGQIRSKDMGRHAAKWVEKDYNVRYPQKIRRRLHEFLPEYRDTVNHIFSQADQALGPERGPFRISAPEASSLYPSVFAYFCYETKDALNRACACIGSSLYLPDRFGPLDLASGRRRRLFWEEKAQLEAARRLCDQIAEENFSNSFPPEKKRQLCLLFIRTVLADSQEQIMRQFSELLNARSMEYQRLKQRVGQVDDADVLAAFDQIEKAGAQPGACIRWIKDEPLLDDDPNGGLLPTHTMID